MNNRLKLRLSRDAIKYIAIITMLLSHIASIFLNKDSLIHDVFVSLGRFTAVTMCFFLVEGYYWSKAKYKYAKRLFIFAFISQIPYNWALNNFNIFKFNGLNMLFSLFLGFLVLLSFEKIKDKLILLSVISLIFLISLLSDWSFFVVLFVLLFNYARHSLIKLKIVYLMIILISCLLPFFNNLKTLPPIESFLYAFGNNIGIILSGIIIVYLYNYKQQGLKRSFNKWFFYIFYPSHFLILGIIKLCLLN